MQLTGLSPTELFLAAVVIVLEMFPVMVLAYFVYYYVRGRNTRIKALEDRVAALEKKGEAKAMTERLNTLEKRFDDTQRYGR